MGGNIMSSVDMEKRKFEIIINMIAKLIVDDIKKKNLNKVN